MTAKRIVIAALLAILPLQALALTSDELLALVAMPLAVAAVSEVTGVPIPELANVAATLNAANVPPVYFVETMRYVPAALVVEAPDQPRFVQWIDTRYDQGITGLALVTEIERQLPIYGIPAPEITVTAPALRPVVVTDDAFFPPVVTTRVEEWRNHPHGGPPGQVKKQLGLQTGAEVVHGTQPGRGNRSARRDDDVNVAPRADRRDDRPAKASKPLKAERRQSADRPRGNSGKGNVSGYVAPARGDGGGRPDHAGGGRGKGGGKPDHAGGGHGNSQGGGGKGHGKGKG